MKLHADHVIDVARPGDYGFLEPGSPAWSTIITPSKVAAILGLSRWESPLSLWLRMKGRIPPDPPKDAFDLGHDAEPFAANRWKRRNPGWKLSPGAVQFHVDPDHFGFPAAATLDRRASRGRSRRVLEVKLARDQSDLERWGDDLSGDLPADYAAQVLTQMIFTGWTTLPGHLLAFGPYWRERIYEVAYHPGAVNVIVTRCRTFWDSLSGDQQPDLDDSVATYEAIRALHPDIDGTVVGVTGEAAGDFLAAQYGAKDAEAAARFAKTRLLAHMGRAQYAEVAGIRIAERRDNGKGGVSFYPKKDLDPEAIRQLKG